MNEDNVNAPQPCNSPEDTRRRDMERRSFLLAIGIVSLLFLLLLRPFFGALFWACAIGVLFHPLQQRLLRLFRGRANTAAFCTLSFCAVIAVVPAWFIVSSFVDEGAALYHKIHSGQIDPAAFVDRVKLQFPIIEETMEKAHLDVGKIKEELSSIVVGASKFLAQNAVAIGQNTVGLLVDLALMLYVAFFMLRDGPKLVALLIRALPLGDEREKMIFGKFAEVTRATVKGNLVVAAVQGSLGGLIFWILGIHGAVLWGVVMTVLSMIPVVGASLIWAPVAAYLFITGETTEGIVLASFGAFVIGLVDNILRPILVGRDTKLPDFIVLLSTLGGFVIFGMNGFVIGPLVAALFVALWEIFAHEYSLAHAPEAPQAAPATAGAGDCASRVPEKDPSEG
jgi:predicted PurR-regulated permease PerM